MGIAKANMAISKQQDYFKGIASQFENPYVIFYSYFLRFIVFVQDDESDEEAIDGNEGLDQPDEEAVEEQPGKKVDELEVGETTVQVYSSLLIHLIKG